MRYLPAATYKWLLAPNLSEPIIEGPNTPPAKAFCCAPGGTSNTKPSLVGPCGTNSFIPSWVPKLLTVKLQPLSPGARQGGYHSNGTMHTVPTLPVHMHTPPLHRGTKLQNSTTRSTSFPQRSSPSPKRCTKRTHLYNESPKRIPKSHPNLHSPSKLFT